MEFTGIVEIVGQGVDIFGIGVIVVGIVLVTVRFVMATLAGRRGREPYDAYREGIGRALLLGLEILVAADIIRTVAITPTFASVIILGLIVMIRTFLSWSLEVELTGRWPWQPRADPTASTSPPASKDSP